MRNLFKNFTFFLVVFLILAGLLSAVNSPWKKEEWFSFNDLVAAVQKGEVVEIIIEGDKLEAVLKDQSRKATAKEDGESLANLLKIYGITEDQLRGVAIANREPSGVSAWMASLAPFFLPLVLFLLFLWLMMRQLAGANSRAMMFGQSTAREENPAKPNAAAKKTTFKDVAGCLEPKQELQEVVEFLKEPKKFQKLGARIPKGALLVGPPGTGKTLLAKAVSGEAGVPFFHMSGSEFVEMFVGVGASRVRDLFRRAKKSAPAIVFIDELDAVGRQRGAGLGGSHDEREQTLNQILVEMDGFETDTNVIIIAATNRPDVLDPALLRPGRFDRRVVIDLPDIREREAILALHAVNKPLVNVDIHKVASRTPGFSGADLFNLLNEAAILAARHNQETVSQDDVLISIEKVMLGPERKSFILSEKEKRITAYHEAGHAVVSHFLPEADPVHKISIIARGRAGGYTIKLPTEDKRLHNKTEFLADLAVLLAGQAIEKEVFHDITTGAGNDLRQATALARQLVTEFGMSEKLGPRTFGDKEELIFLGREISEQRDYGEKVAQAIDEEISSFLEQAYKRAQEVIRANQDKIERVVEVLLKQETIEAEEFKALMA